MQERNFEQARSDDNYDFGNDETKQRYNEAARRQRESASNKPLPDLKPPTTEPQASLPFEGDKPKEGPGSENWENLKKRLGSNKKIA